MSQWQFWWGLGFLGIGLSLVGRAWLNFDAIMKTPQAEGLVEAFGRNGARVFYIIVGVLIAILGLFILSMLDGVTAMPGLAEAPAGRPMPAVQQPPPPVPDVPNNRPPPAPADPSPAADVPSVPNFRTWTDTTGSFRVEAQLVDRGQGTVTLEKRGGETIDVPLERLSEADRSYLAEDPSTAD